MPGWFDLSDWPIGPDATDDVPGLLWAVSATHAAIAELEASGVASENIVVGTGASGVVPKERERASKREGGAFFFNARFSGESN